MNEEDRAPVEMMIRFGGSFVRALGEACKYADSENIKRIKEAFPEYWERYTKMAIHVAKNG